MKKQSKWLQKKIAAREEQLQRPGVKQRQAEVDKLINKPELERSLLNSLLDDWEMKEYGEIRTR